MTRKIRNYLFLLVILTVFCSWTEPRKFSYVDKFGNTISLENIDKLPRHLDTTFFKSNLTGLHLLPDETDSTLRFFYTIMNIRTITKNKEYEIRVFISPNSDNPLFFLKYNTCTFYSMKIKNVNHKITIEKVIALRSET